MRIARRLQMLRAAVAAIAVAGLFGLSAAPGVASPALSRAPVNPAFKLYGQAAAQGAAGAAARGVGGPAPSVASGLVPSPVDIGALSAAGPVRAAASALPSSFDLRSAAPARLSPVENQGSYGTCWAFAALGSLESALWSSVPADTARFSENNLVLKSGYYSQLDDAGLYSTGGNSLMATAYLARWAGPVLWSQDVYGHSTPSGLTAARHVQDVLYVPGRTGPTDNDGIKSAVMKYGAVYVAFTWAWNASYWQGTTHAYYDPVSEVTNHAVDIVGWDDSYAASNFASRPPGDGAFIVRNSWGASFGDSGYFHLSYYDANLALLDVSGQEDGNAVFVAAQPSDNYDTKYQYDPLGWTTSIGFGASPTGWFANRFTASADGTLKAVSFYAARPGSAYTVLEGSSTSALTPVAGGTLDLPGYHTVALDSSPALTGGDKFVVAVKLTTPGYDYPIPAEYPITDFYGYTAGATASPGQSYVSPDGSTWTDVTTMSGYANTNVCLKAFADRAAGTVYTPTVTLRLSGLTAGAAKVGRTVTARGTAAPASLAGGKVTVTAQRKKGGSWVQVMHMARTISAAGAFTCSLKPAVRGTYRMKAVIAATSSHTAAATKWVSFTAK